MSSLQITVYCCLFRSKYLNKICISTKTCRQTTLTCDLNYPCNTGFITGTLLCIHVWTLIIQTEYYVSMLIHRFVLFWVAYVKGTLHRQREVIQTDTSICSCNVPSIIYLFYNFSNSFNIKTADFNRTLRSNKKKHHRCDVTIRLLLITHGGSVIRDFNLLHTVEAWYEISNLACCIL